MFTLVMTCVGNDMMDKIENIPDPSQELNSIPGRAGEHATNFATAVA